MTLDLALVIHCVVLTIALVGAAVVLWRHRLLGLSNSGTWLLFAFALYFVYNPGASLWNDDLARYEDAIFVFGRDGLYRVFWILGVVVAGLLAFVLAYIPLRLRVSDARMAPTPAHRWSILSSAVLAVFLALAVYSLLFFRTRGAFVESTIQVEYEDGKIVGGATGYTVIAHGFFLYIITLLLLRGPAGARLLGSAIAVAYLGMRLYDTHDRASIVSLMLAVVLVVATNDGFSSARIRAATGRLRRNWLKAALLIAATVAMTAFLVVRGHSSVAEIHEVDWGRGEVALRQSDTAMLPVFYVESSLAEEIGYDYGVPLASRMLFGWLPRQYFPWKDDLESVLLDQDQRRLFGSTKQWLLGAKSTILGSFYWHGNIVGVMLGMAFLGWLARRLDRLVAAGRTDIGRAVGIVWMSNLWMMFASSDIWVLGNLFINGMPFFALWLVSKMENYRPVRQPFLRSSAVNARKTASAARHAEPNHIAR